MDSSEIKRRLKDIGVFKSGIAEIRSLEPSAAEEFDRWIAEGCHGEMAYLEKYPEIRRDPSLLLPGARSLISCTFNYYTRLPSSSRLQWANYALGDDYHDIVRAKLGEIATQITAATGAECRVCVDTAPLHERYWAVQAGVGFIGLNRQLIVPGAGSHFFLGEILTTLQLDADAPCTLSCGECRRCITACPGHALDPRIGMDARHCLSYLTIEHRGEFPPDVNLSRHIYGCDVCQDVCPHNRNAPETEIEEFRPRPAILSLSTDDILRMEQADFSAIFRKSAIKRTKLTGLRRNAGRIDSGDSHT